MSLYLLILLFTWYLYWWFLHLFHLFIQLFHFFSTFVLCFCLYKAYFLIDLWRMVILIIRKLFKLIMFNHLRNRKKLNWFLYNYSIGILTFISTLNYFLWILSRYVHSNFKFLSVRWKFCFYNKLFSCK